MADVVEIDGKWWIAAGKSMNDPGGAHGTRSRSANRAPVPGYSNWWTGEGWTFNRGNGKALPFDTEESAQEHYDDNREKIESTPLR